MGLEKGGDDNGNKEGSSKETSSKEDRSEEDRSEEDRKEEIRESKAAWLGNYSPAIFLRSSIDIKIYFDKNFK